MEDLHMVTKPSNLLIPIDDKMFVLTPKSEILLETS